MLTPYKSYRMIVSLRYNCLNVVTVVNYGSLILKALLEHWTAASQIQDDAEDEQSATSQANSSPEYFNIPGHTPLIISEVVGHYP